MCQLFDISCEELIGPKESLLFDRTYYQYLIIALRYHLQVNISIQKLNINIVLGIL